MNIKQITEGKKGIPSGPDMRPMKGNPVAKNMNKSNKPATHRNRKTDYQRKPKHPEKDMFEAPVVTHGKYNLTNMVKTEFYHWISQEHTVEELKKVMNAMGFTLKSDGERSEIDTF